MSDAALEDTLEPHELASLLEDLVDAVPSPQDTGPPARPFFSDPALLCMDTSPGTLPCFDGRCPEPGERAAPLHRSVPGASVARPKRDDPTYSYLAPVDEGPLALLVLEDLADAWVLEASLARMGWRTTVRIGADEALHAIYDEQPALTVLSARRGGDGMTFLRVASRFVPDLPRHVIAVGCGPRGDARHDVLASEGVRAFIEERSTPESLRELMGHLGMPTELEPTEPPVVLAGLAAALGRAADDEELGHMPGSTICERFVVEKRIGRGAAASVYQVRDLLLQVRVALKVLSRSAAMDNALERFRREMLICRGLIHPNVVRTYDFGVSQGQPFYTMELLQGSSLDVVVDSGPGGRLLPIGDRLHIMAQAFAGLDAVHSAGVLHRDVKSGNVFILDSGVVKIVDFGVARFEGAEVAISQEGLMLGSPSWTAPEVLLDGAPASIAADVYGMGVVAWELLTGRLPWRAVDLQTLMTELAVRPPPDPRRLEPELTQEAATLLRQVVSRDPGARPTAADLVRRLELEAKKLGWRNRR